MRKNDFAGWQDVFRFSLIQGAKQKSFYVFLIVMAIFTIGFGPVKSFISHMKEDSGANTKIRKVIVFDDLGSGHDYSGFLDRDKYPSTEVETQSGDRYEAELAALELESESKEILIHVELEEEGYFHLTFVKATKSGISRSDCEDLAEAFQAFFQDVKLRGVGVTDQQFDFINREVVTDTLEFDEKGDLVEKNQDTLSMDEYFVALACILVMMLLVNFSGATIANSIVTEKSTRVVEYLMINVRPMALIIGKLLSSVVLVILQFAVIGVSYLISIVIQKAMFPEAAGSEGIASKLDGLAQIMPQLNAVTFLLVVVAAALGVLFFGMVAGLAGASVSKLEELPEAMRIYQFSLIIGTYIGLFLCIGQMTGGANPIVVNICCMIPIATPFVMPGYLLMGKISILVALIGLALLAIVTVGLFVFTAKVYESLIFYNGNIMKLKDILMIAKNRRGGEK